MVDKEIKVPGLEPNINVLLEKFENINDFSKPTSYIDLQERMEQLHEAQIKNIKKNRALGLVEKPQLNMHSSGTADMLIQMNAQEMKEELKRDIDRRFREMLKEISQNDIDTLINKHQIIVEKMARPGQFKGKCKSGNSNSPKNSPSFSIYSDYGSDFEQMTEEEKSILYKNPKFRVFKSK